MRQYQDQCLENPDIVYNKESFLVTIPTSTRSYVFEHNKPVTPQSLFPAERGKKTDEFSHNLETVVKWITGGPDGMRSHETDIYGVVQIQMEDFSSQIVDFSSLAAVGTEKSEKESVKEYENARKNFMKKANAAMTMAQEIADTRVRRALKISHENLVKQWDALQQDGKGKYAPSIAEAVGAQILHKEIDKAGQKKREMVERFVKIAENTVIM